MRIVFEITYILLYIFYNFYCGSVLLSLPASVVEIRFLAQQGKAWIEVELFSLKKMFKANL